MKLYLKQPIFGNLCPILLFKSRFIYLFINPLLLSNGYLWVLSLTKCEAFLGMRLSVHHRALGYLHCLESGVTFSMRAIKFSRNSVLLSDRLRSLQYSLGYEEDLLIGRMKKLRLVFFLSELA